MVWICRSNHASPDHTELMCIPTGQRWAPHMENLEQHQGSVCFESWASGGNNPSSLSGFSSNQPGILLPPRTILIKVSGGQLWFFPRQFRGLAILFPLWLETSQCPSLTSSVVIPAVDSLAGYEPWWSCTGAFSGLCHPQKWSAIITTACNKFSNINCTIPALEPRKTNTILPPPWLWFHVSSTTQLC